MLANLSNDGDFSETINMKYQYPYIRSHKFIKQGYIGSSKIQKETWIPETRG